MLGFSSIGQSLISWFLRRFLDQYVEDIQSHVKDFQYGLSGGTLLLDNLNLKAEALVELDLPIEVKAGHIGLLEVRLPALTRIRTDPLVVKVENVLLLASPICDRKYDETKDEAIRQAHKRQLLLKLDQLLQQEQQDEEEDSDAIKDPGFLERIKVTVMQNIQVQITDIHIRYEDDVTNQSTPFAFGITLQELSLQPSETQPSSSQHVHKLLKLKELAVYWNRLQSTKQMLKDNLDGWKSTMANSIDQNALHGVTFDHLVAPINGSAQLVISLQEKTKDPIIACTGSFEHITINFKRHMFLNAVILKDSFAMMRVNEKYRRFHPGVPCRGNSQLWWHYAYFSIIQEVVMPKREFWSRIWDYRSMYKNYRDLYTQKLLSPDKYDEAKIDEYEMELNIESIVMARKEAERLYLVQKPHMAVEKEASGGMFTKISNWWYGESSATEVVVHAKHPGQDDNWWRGLSEEEKKEVYEAFDYSQDQPIESTNNAAYVRYKLDVKFEGIQLNLQMNTRTETIHVVTLYIADISGVLDVRTQGLKFHSTVKYLEVYQSADSTNRKYLAKVDTSYVHIPTTGNSLIDSTSLLSVLVERYPTDVDADVSLRVKTLPLQLVYDHEVACAAMAFFYIPVEKYSIGAKLKNFSPEFSTAGLQYAIDKHQRLYVEATLCSPYLIIPSDGLLSANCRELIVDFGVLKVDTELPPKKLRLEDNSLENRERAIYDKYTLNLSDVKILYTGADVSIEEKNDMRRRANSHVHVMPSLSLTSVISLSAEPNFKRLPRFKIDSCLDCLQIKLSTTMVESLLSLFYTFPHPSAQQCFDKYQLSQSSSKSGRGTFDCVDNHIASAGIGYLMRSELEHHNSLIDEVDFERIQRLEDKDIFVTQGDLLNLWFLLSTETGVKRKHKTSESKPGRGIGGLNDVADLLLDPDGVRVQNYEARSDDEEEFVLAAESTPTTGLHLPGLNGYTGTEFYTLLLTTFTIKEVSVKLMCGRQDYLTAALQDVTGRACKTNCCFSVSLQMRRFKVTDDLHLSASRDTLHIARSPQSESMATFEGRFMDDVTKVTFTKVANAIMLNLATIQLCIHDESTKRIIQEVVKISNVLKVLQKSSEPRSLSTKHSPTNTSACSLRTAYTEKDVFYDAVSKLDAASLRSRRSLLSIGTSYSRARDMRKNKSLHDAGADVISWDIKCCLKSIKLELQRGFEIIAELNLSDVNITYEMTNTHWSTDGKLGALSLTDLKASIYQRVLVVEEGLKDVMTFHFTSYNQSVQRHESCDQQLNMTLNRMRLVFINKFVSRLTTFFGQFSSPGVEKVHETSKQKIASTAHSVHKKCTITRICVEVNAPLITVPENGVSRNALLFRLGDLSVGNEYITSEISGHNITTSQTYDKMALTLKNIAIERITYVDEHKYLLVRQLLTPVTTQVVVKRAVTPVASSAVDFEINADINQFKLEASQVDMQLIGKVLYENVLTEDRPTQSYAANLNVTDVGSTISSALSSTASTNTPDAKAVTIKLNLGGLLLHIKREEEPSNVLQNISTDLAVMNIAELKVDFCKGKKEAGMSCVVTLRDFIIEDRLAVAEKEFNTNRVIQLDDKANRVLLVKFNMDVAGNSELFCAVEKMRFNVNLPFVKGMLTFLQESFATWKSAEPANARPAQGRRGVVGARRRRLNTTAMGRRVSRISAPKSELLADTKMVINLKFGKQSLYMITGDGSQKALVAEMNMEGRAELGSAGTQEADIQLTELTVYTTSLQSDLSHLQHQCLQPCVIQVTYSSISPLPQFQSSIPPKVDIEVSLSKVDIKLSTNVIYHAFDAMALLRGEDTTDDATVVGFQSNEADLNVMKVLDREEWLKYYGIPDNHGDVEMNPMKAALESLTIREFDLDIEFAVAIGEEFIPILETHSHLSASVKDWSTKLRAECCFSFDCNYFNELLDVWEPLVERMFDEKTGKYRRWEILARLTTDKSHPIAKTDPNDILVDSQELDTFIHHQMSSAKERQATRAAVEGTAVMDEVDKTSAADSEEPIMVASAATPAVGQQNNKPNNRNTPDVILEEDEEEEDDFDQRPMLASAGLPRLYITQPSDSTDDVDGVGYKMKDEEGKERMDERYMDERDIHMDETEAAIEDGTEVLCTYLSLVSRDKLLLNVSPQGLNVLTSVIDTFTKKPSDSTLFEVYKSHPLIITNELGTGAKVCLDNATRKLDVKLEHVTIDDEMVVTELDRSIHKPTGFPALDVDYSEDALRTLAALAAPAATVHMNRPSETRVALKEQQLHLAINGYHPIPAISFGKTQCRHFSAKPRDKMQQHLCLRVRTQSTHGRRHVFIYSPLEIRNELLCAVEVSYQELTHDVESNQHTTTRHCLGIVSPDAVLHVPSVVALQKRLFVKPVADGSGGGAASEYGESNDYLMWRDHLKSKSGANRPTSPQQILTCSNLLQQTFTFKAVWLPRTCNAEKCSGICPSFDVILEPSAEVKNFLPYPVTLDVLTSASVGSQSSHYQLEPGENVQITDSISTSRKCKLLLPHYQGTSWSGHLDIHSKMAENARVPLTLKAASGHDSASAEGKDQAPKLLTISTNITRAPGHNGRQGQLQIAFFSAYWISNTTGLTLQFKSSGLGSTLIETHDPQPILYMTSTLNSKLMLRIPGYKWSKAFAVDAAGTVGTVSSLSTDSRHKYRFMVETTLSNTQLSKTVTIFPMFVVLNKMEEALMFRECSAGGKGMSNGEVTVEIKCADDNHNEGDGEGLIAMSVIQHNSWTCVAPGQVVPFWPTRRTKPLSMVVKREGSDTSTAAFPASSAQRTLLPITNQAVLTADVSGGIGTEYFISLRQYQLGDSVVRIENLTEYPLLFTQGIQSESDAVIVDSCKSWLYYWPNPMKERQLYWSVPSLKRKPSPAKYIQDGCGTWECLGKRIYWQSYGDNLQRALIFSETEKFQEIVRKKNHREQATLFMFAALESASLSMINKQSLEIGLLSVNQSPAKWYVKPDGHEKWLPLGVKLSEVVEEAYCDPKQESLHLIQDNSHLEVDFNELRFVQPIEGVLKRDSFPGLKLQYQTSELSMVVQASINHLQLDNQLPDAFYPVAFHPISQSMCNPKPCIQLFVRRQFPLDGSVDTYKRLDLCLEQAALKIDKGFMLSTLDFIADCRKSDDADQDKLMKSYHEKDIEYCLQDLSADTILKTDKTSGTKIYVEQLRLSDIRIKLSFSMAGNAHLTEVENTRSTFGGDVVDFLLRSIGMTLTEVTDIDFSLDSFMMLCVVLTTDQLTSDLMTFYKTQAMSQAYVFVLGLDIIGNPLGLAKDVQKGLKDFFSSADPLSFNNDSKMSLSQGMKSAYGNIIGGICGTGSKITESLGRGINVLSFDKSFQRARSQRVKSQPLHLPQSLLLSAKTIGFALGSGLTGLVTQPKKGVKKQGAAGFFKGIGKGVTGVVVKPAGGVFDSVSVLLDGFRRATQSDINAVEKIRLPRYTIPSEGVTSYHPYLAEGVHILHTMNLYKYSADDIYWCHLHIREDGKQYTALATTKTLYLLHIPWYSSLSRPIWSIPVEELRKPTYSEGVITLRRTGKEDKKLHHSEHETLEWFNERLNALFP